MVDGESPGTISIEEAETLIKPPTRKFDVMVVYIPPERRMPVMDALLKSKLTRDMTMLEAMMIVFQLPSLVLHCVSLEDARAMELILEYVGAVPQIRVAKHCGND